ncbi:unnamed protein product [Calypogeia fissa]
MEMAQTEKLAKKTVIKLVLLGCGGVGRHLLQRIITTRALHESAGLHLAVVAVSDSKGFVLSTKELVDSVLNSIISAKHRNVNLSEWYHSSPNEENCEFNAVSRHEATLQLLRTWDLPTVVVDCTASEETGELLGMAAAQGFYVVLANKKPITSSLNVYDQITSLGRRFRCESTVGAGLPVMATLSRTLAAGDPIHRIVGALSGTLGYVMSGLQDGRPYSEVVATAKKLGYTEPDPRDDLSGLDVARKALIMARAMGWRLDLEEVEVESLYPSEMRPQSMPLEEFLSKGVPSLDLSMHERVQAALGRKAVLRYVATIENGKCKVGFMQVSPDSPVGRLCGSDNLLEIYTDCYKEAPLVIQGAGAGNDTTAAGVLADIIDLQDLFKI